MTLAIEKTLKMATTNKIEIGDVDSILREMAKRIAQVDHLKIEDVGEYEQAGYMLKAIAAFSVFAAKP